MSVPESLRYCATCTWWDARQHRLLHGVTTGPLFWGLCLQRIPQVLLERVVDPETVRRDLSTETRSDETCGNWTPREAVIVRFV